MTTTEAIDYADCIPAAEIPARYSVVGRYLSSFTHSAALPHKVLTPAERDDLLHHGKDIILFYEDGTSDTLKGAAEGTADGKTAAAQLKELGAPHGMTIYVTVDVETHDWAHIEAYIANFAKEIPGYHVGGYGSYDVCSELLGHRVIVQAVQTRAWSHGEVLGAAAIYQNADSVSIAGVSCDIDIIQHPEFGSWRQAIAAAARPKPTTHAWYRRLLELRHPMTHGADVQYVQRKLGCTPDGWYGPITEAHVKAFQRGHRLVVDGIVGPHTAAALG